MTEVTADSATLHQSHPAPSDAVARGRARADAEVDDDRPAATPRGAA